MVIAGDNLKVCVELIGSNRDAMERVVFTLLPQFREGGAVAP